MGYSPWGGLKEWHMIDTMTDIQLLIADYWQNRFILVWIRMHLTHHQKTPAPNPGYCLEAMA